MANKVDRRLLMVLHAAGLSALVAPLGGPVLLAWILWLGWKERDPLIDRQGRAALNFHISILLYQSLLGLILAGLALYAFFATGASLPDLPEFGDETMIFNLLPVVIAAALIVLAAVFLWLFALCTSLVNVLRSFTEDDWIYPLSIRWLKT